MHDFDVGILILGLTVVLLGTLLLCVVSYTLALEKEYRRLRKCLRMLTDRDARGRFAKREDDNGI